MDTLSVILVAIALFAVFVLLTAYFLKSSIVMNSINKGTVDNSFKKEELSSDYPATEEHK